MLIYIRETERKDFLSDELSKDEQIPKELQEHFNTEAKFFDNIWGDFESQSQFKNCHILSEETLLESGWDGLLVSKNFKDTSIPDV